jgi:fructuronate reductase
VRRLSLAELPAPPARPDYDPARVRVGVVHFGPGAFHRAHQLDYLDRLLAADPRWGVCGVSLRSPRVREALKPQDWLFALSILDETPSVRVLGALRKILFAREEAGALARRLAAPETQLVTLTITEAGYCLSPDGTLDLQHADIRADLAGAPTSALGWIVHGLSARRAAGLAPFAVVSCDNLAGNGAKLKAALVALAGAQDAALARWIEANGQCPNTMVDAITPATDDAVRARVAEALGVEDAAPVQREAFADWVIEAYDGPQPDWAAAGAIVAPDAAPFAAAKLRLLNGAHSSLAYIGLAAGFETVSQAMRAPWLEAFARGLMQDAKATLAPTPGRDLDHYIEAILKRFRNPAIAHALRQIAMDGSQKLPIRILSTISDRLAMRAPVGRLCWTIAAWMRHLRRSVRTAAPIADPLAAPLAALAARAQDRAESDAPLFLTFDAVFPPALARNEGFFTAVSRAYAILVEAEAGPHPAAFLAARMHEAT